jgi:hypothetical protein
MIPEPCSSWFTNKAGGVLWAIAAGLAAVFAIGATTAFGDVMRKQ